MKDVVTSKDVYINVTVSNPAGAWYPQNWIGNGRFWQVPSRNLAGEGLMSWVYWLA